MAGSVNAAPHGDTDRHPGRKPSPVVRENTGPQRRGASWVRRMRVRWQDGTPASRTAMAAVAAILVLACVFAMVTGVRALVRHAEISQAKARQFELTQDYGFDPGDIISDARFFDGDAMDAAQVQEFLDDQGAACTGSGCLRSRTFEVATREADDYCAGYEPSAQAVAAADKATREAQAKAAHGTKVEPVAPQETAATIIAGAAASCRVSPEVLLTVMQKEQQLVTAADPTEFQFKAAMGLSCPDDDQCDPQYAGFFNQVYGAAERYRYYEAHEDRYGYHADSLNYILFNPDTACGGANVWIENKATALLYIYTPYQPNQAALAAGAGEGDACSTYGNRNFSLIYSGWFGDPRS